MMRRIVPLLAFALASCGLHPLYGGGSSGGAAATLSTVQVGPIDGQTGWLVRFEADESVEMRLFPSRETAIAAAADLEGS